MKTPTRQEVIERAEVSPLLQALLTWWRMGELTWEHTMMIAVLELDKQCDELQAELRRKNESHTHEG